MNNLFYKSLATISTVGILALSTTQVLNAMKKSNSSEVEISKTLVELKKVRKEALNEIKTAKEEILNELNKLKSSSLQDYREQTDFALNQLEKSKSESLKVLKEAGGISQGSAHMILTGYVNGSSSSVIPMKDLDQCEEQGVLWMSSQRARFHLKYKGFECLESR